uniref:F-box associated beta-propeller type 3 domain-containing protein n=1 Tax=Leersia perrieri TaxID=77586 RepID=A0A0D9W450_9ORYZ
MKTSHCNGIVAVIVKVGKIFVCKEFFVLPPGSRGTYDRNREEAATLGFDPITGRYVVARCLYRHYDCHTDENSGEQFLQYDIVHEVFVLGASGSGGWEITETPPCPIDDVVPPACAHGAFYWAANDQSNEAERERPNALLRWSRRMEGERLHVGKVFVCNPATREFFVLPPGSRIHHYHLNQETASLGFDPFTDTYVLARWLYSRYDLYTDFFTGEQFLDYEIHHEVFTLGASGSGDWETTETSPCPIHESMLPACVRGAFYWAANDQSDEAERRFPNSLLRYDIHDGEFAVVSLPSCYAFMVGDGGDSLTDLHGELCYARPNTETAFDFWVLEADENEEEFRWSLRWHLNLGVPIGIIVPLSVERDGTLIIYEEGLICRLDEGRNVVEREVDVEEVYWDLVGQWGIDKYDYPKNCGNGGAYDCRLYDGGGGGGGNINVDELVMALRNGTMEAAMIMSNMATTKMLIVSNTVAAAASTIWRNVAWTTTMVTHS